MDLPNCLSVVDGGYSKWGSWGECSVPCGRGKQMRYRKCDNPVPKRGGKGCGELGPARELRTCQGVCPPGEIS